MHGGQLGAAEVSHPCACYVTEPALTPTSHEHATLVTGPLACVSAAFVGSASRTGARQDDQLALPAVVSPERFANQHAVAAPGGLTHGAAAGRSIRPPPIRQCPGSALASVPVSLLDAHLFVSTASDSGCVHGIPSPSPRILCRDINYMPLAWPTAPGRLEQAARRRLCPAPKHWQLASGRAHPPSGAITRAGHPEAPRSKRLGRERRG